VSELDKRRYIIMESLQHYCKALTKLLAKEELPEIVKLDLKNEYVKLYLIQDTVQTKGIKQNIDESRSVLEIEDNAKLVCSALTCYVKDLEKLISEIDELYGDNTIPLEFTRQDIELTQKVLVEIPRSKQSSSST
jgi:hypothetical protein